MPTMKPAPHNAESIRQIAKRLNSLVLRLQAVAEILDVYQVESVEITHQAELLNGLQRVENWGDAVHRCVQKHLQDQGAYQAPDSAVSAPRKKR